MSVRYDSTTDPRKLAENQRALAQQRGDELNQQNQDLSNQAAEKAQDYSGFLDPITEEMAAGNGGYRPDEINDIMQRDAAPGNFLTGDEQKGITGDTGSYRMDFNPAEMANSQADSSAFQRQAAQDLKSGMRDSIDPQSLTQSGDYRARTQQALGNNNHETWNTIQSGAGNVRGAIGDEATQVRGAIDPSSVVASQKFLDSYQMSPEEQQNIVTGAGISEGVKNQAAVGALQRQAAAAGASPMGVAAYRARMNRQSAGEAGDAMTKARIQASDAAAGRKFDAEKLRQQGGQFLTNTKVGSELSLGQQRAGAEQGMAADAIKAQEHLGDQALGQANTEEANRQAANQYLTGAQLHSAEVGGQAALGTEGNINAQQRQQQQYNATQGTGIAMAQDAANSQRAGQVATNRQGIGLTNQANTSQRATQVGNTRVGQQNVGIGAVTGQQQEQNQDQQNAQNRQLQNYATQSNATGQAAELGQKASQNPSMFDKVLGGVTGAIGAVGGALALEDGGVVTEPTLAIVGESGPEMVTPIGYRANAKARPSVAFGNEQIRGRKFYGEAA